MFFDNKESPAVGSQQVKGSCTFCRRKVTSTGATRMVDHIFKDCVLMPSEVKAGFVCLREGTVAVRVDKRKEEALIIEERDVRAPYLMHAVHAPH